MAGSFTDDELLRLVELVPDGWSEAWFDGDRWGVEASSSADGAAWHITARRFADGRVLGANLYVTSTGPILRPCEVPRADVLDFLTGFHVVAPRDDGSRLLTRPARPPWRDLWWRWRLRRRMARAERPDA